MAVAGGGLSKCHREEEKKKEKEEEDGIGWMVFILFLNSAMQMIGLYVTAPSQLKENMRGKSNEPTDKIHGRLLWFLANVWTNGKGVNEKGHSFSQGSSPFRLGNG